ncbi:O-antigen ligase family protein [Viridibacillus sp. YIM B01967]|uniref:O-antigen ligase family protein n=1 Tax=Viridibacillus soli TaxID=2798301 RepID=A0ABS1HCM1_9BACL|nr:O-antigen ligase family protein [Viridibacillus soli]MBK3497130.1 O-antigen ligase family protein [Viridibacillus soli]
MYSREITIDEKENQQSRASINRWLFILLLAAIAVIPLLIGGAKSEVIGPKITDIIALTSGKKSDFYTHYKAILLMCISALAVVLMLIKILFFDGSIRKTKVNVCIGIFVVGIILSTIFSPSASIALWGQYNRSDGAITYICYLILFFVALNIEYPKKAIEYMMAALYPFVLLNTVLITMYFYGHDALQYGAFKRMMILFLPEGFSINEGATILGTLNQMNYMSGMFAIMTVMYLAWAIIDSHKARSVINAVVASICIGIMFMSLSTSGFLTVVVISPILIWLTIKGNHTKQAIIALSVFLVLSVPLFHILSSHNERVWTESFGFIVKKNPYIEEVTAINLAPFEAKVYAANSKFELPILPQSGTAAASGRAYIWSKAIDMVMERPVFGYGLDTIMYYFPHYSLDARANMISETTIVDKPHSLYVGILYGTGIVGFIGFICLVGIIIFLSLKQVYKEYSSSHTILAVGVIAYFIQALFNDSLPGTSATLWAISGIMVAFALNIDSKKESTNGRNN